MLRTREPVTLRALVAGTQVSTMAVYTHFGSMDGLWRALRQEGFTLLAARLRDVTTTTDPVRDLAALTAAYVDHAVAHPDLYRVMFDPSAELEDLQAADGTLERFVQAVSRARAAGRLDAETDPLELATRVWASGHGPVSLVVNGPLPHEALAHVPQVLIALLVSAGDERSVCAASVGRGWRRAAAGG
jgi:AcrR family transcriptional regulator